MKLQLKIEYRTRWGEQLFVRTGNREIPLEYIGSGQWEGCIPDYAAGAEYTYVVKENGSVTRIEWHGHRIPALCSGERKETCTADVSDKWNDIPSDAPLYTSAFTEGIFGRKKRRKKITAHSKETPARRKNAGIVFLTDFADIRPGEVLAIAGSIPELGTWTKPLLMDDTCFPHWKAEVKAGKPFFYKYLIVDRATLNPVAWEDGDNRYFSDIPDRKSGRTAVAASDVPAFRNRYWRGAGTAIPVFSLRSRDGFGTGEFQDLKKLADWMSLTGQNIIQILPVNDTTMTGTWQDSYPYKANSSFALHPQFLNLPAAGVPADEEYMSLKKELNSLPEIDYERVNSEKSRLLRKFFDNGGKSVLKTKEYIEFVAGNAEWLIPYAAFCSLRDKFGTADFSRWGEFSKFGDALITEYCKRNKKDIDFHCFVQYNLHLQLSDACAYAHSKGVILKGDLPIGISRTSTDAWLHPELFHMDSQAGAPPDAFSEFGQNWGLPTYDWEKMAKDGFAWWKARLNKMSEYFDAFRIDHILGFFRIWEIPSDAVHGLLGHFNPALPYSTEELKDNGFDISGDRFISPFACDGILNEIFGDRAESVRKTYMKDGKLKPAYSTQRKIAEKLSKDEKTKSIAEGLMTLLDDVLFIEDPHRKGFYHPRIAAHSTFTYRSLPEHLKKSFDRLYDDFFYRRHNEFWKQSALNKLPALLASTGMLACGEDLGMIPDCVPEVMDRLKILSLEIQRMPKSITETFANPAHYPYFSVCTTSTHDMNPLRAWWEEDRELTGRFYREILKGSGDAPYFCEPWICRQIISMHLASPSMLAILPLQDWLSMDGRLRLEDPHKERINVPAIPIYYWRYRMHLTIESLMKEKTFNENIKEMIRLSGRSE